MPNVQQTHMPGISSGALCFCSIPMEAQPSPKNSADPPTRPSQQSSIAVRYPAYCRCACLAQKITAFARSWCAAASSGSAKSIRFHDRSAHHRQHGEVVHYGDNAAKQFWNDLGRHRAHEPFRFRDPTRPYSKRVPTRTYSSFTTCNLHAIRNGVQAAFVCTPFLLSLHGPALWVTVDESGKTQGY